MSVEELLEKYKGAYASDFEAPSASGSKDSSDSEVSGDEEEETDEDESDAETNSSSSGVNQLICACFFNHRLLILIIKQLHIFVRFTRRQRSGGRQ